MLVSSASIFAIADAFVEAISAFSSAAFNRGDAFALDLAALAIDQTSVAMR